MTRNKRTLAAITATKRTKTRNAVKRAVDPDRTSLQDLLTLLHLQLVPFLTPHDLSRLLQICSHLLQSDVVDAVATAGLKGFYQQHGVHFGQKCIADWHQLVPEEAEGGIGSCVVCDTKPPSDLPVPRLGDKRMHLLAAVCLTHEGLGQVCDGVLQMPFGRYATLSYGSMQPVVFSLATALEEEGRIDTDSVDELTRLLDNIQVGFGTQFFSNRKQHCPPTNSVEAHWRSIIVDPKTHETTCCYCEDVANNASMHRCERCTEVYVCLLQQHCKALYQPLKQFMTRHLKHVRYVKPCRGWNSTSEEFRGDHMLDLIAGFTPTGVLCGVYLTDLRIPYRSIRGRLASGAFER